MGRMLSSKPFPAPRAGQAAPVAQSKPAPGSFAAGRPTGAAAIAPLAPPRETSQPRSASQLRPDPDTNNPFRKIALFFGLAALFVRFSVLPELIAYVTGVNTYLLYVTAFPALVACIFSGGVQRTFRAKATYWWMALVLWIAVAIPFSSWRGDSTRLLITYVRTDLVFILIAGGLIIQWKEVRAVFYTLAAAAVVNLITSRLFTDTTNGRITLTASGTIGNSNDLAAHLLLIMPFLLFVTMDPKRSSFIRVPLILGIAYGINVILGTASRGALIALITGFVFMLLRATPTQRVLAVTGGLVLTLVFLAVLPSLTLRRLGNLFGEEHEEAKESGESRAYLFRTSLFYTIQHPLFGVGPGQFANFEGNQRIAQGKLGNWHETHCVFTQVSSECGIPALIFFLGGIASAIGIVYRTHKKARLQRDVEVKNVCFCFLLAVVCYTVAATFLSHAYVLYWPVIIGLAGAISFAGEQKLTSSREKAVWQPAPAARLA